MKYYLGYKEYMIKSDNSVFIKDESGYNIKARIILTNRNLMVFYNEGNESEESLRIYPIEYFNTYDGNAQINTGGGNQPFFEVLFPMSSLYVFFGHSIKRGWQLQAEERVQQWVTAINSAVARYQELLNERENERRNRQGQYSNNYIYHITNTPVTPVNQPRASFCSGCGSPIGPDDTFCVAGGRRVI